MSPRSLWTIALAILALPVSAGAQAPVAQPPGVQTPFGQGSVEQPKEPAKATGLVIGTVVNGLDQSPVPAAVVTMTPSGRNAFQFGNRVLTDANGRFYFRDVEVARFDLTADKPGWVQGAHGRNRPGGETTQINMEEGQRRTLSIAMWRPAVISGRVIDDAGEPFIRAAVRIYQRSFFAGRPHWTFRLRVFTDDRGVYRFSNLVPGNYVVVVPAAVTSEPAALRLQAPLPETYLQTMTANGAAPVMSQDTPTLVTRSSQPLIGAALGMPRLPAAEGPWLTYPTTFYPTAQTIGSATVIAALAGRERANVDITVRMTPTVQVSGTVMLPDGAPASFYAVHLLPGGPGEQAVLDVATAVTDTNGAFTFYGVPAGPYIARVVKVPKPGAGMQLGRCGGTGAIPFVCVTGGGPGMVPGVSTDPLLFAEQSLTVSNDPIANVPLMLRAGARVTGGAEFEGVAEKPQAAQLAMVSVWLERADGRAAEPANGFDITMPGRFSADSQFSTASTAPGRYLIRASDVSPWFFKGATYQGRDVSETPFDLSGDISEVVLTFVDTRPGIEGTVVDANGRPDERAAVLLFPTDPAKWIDYGRRTRVVRPGRTTDGGKLAMPPPPDGEYFIIAIPDEQMIDWQNPAFFEKVATRAERIHVIDTQLIRVNLQTKRVE